MNEVKNEAIRALNELHSSIDYNAYCAIHDGLTDIETLRDRDEALEELWDQFADIPMNPDTEVIEAPFLGWGAGVSREEIWHWFDRRYSKGVVGLLHPGEDAREADRLYKLKQSCIECECEECGFNSSGWCRFPMVHGRQPVITEDDGCTEFALKEEV